MKFLFTTLPSNDLGLLTRSLPIAQALKQNGHEILFSSPAKAPSILIAEAGFPNLVPEHPLYQIRRVGLKDFCKISSQNDEYHNVFKFVFELLRALPVKFAPTTTEVWNMDHAAAMAGMMNGNFVRANCDAYRKLILKTNADIIIDFWNPFACIAARALHKPLITVIQADAHPANRGFIWWKEPPQKLPSALQPINKVLMGYGLKPIAKVEDLSLGDLTLIMGTPETDPVPDSSGCTYIGPILWEKPDDNLPNWVERIEGTKPLIWVYSGNPRYGPKETKFDSKIIIQASSQVLSKLDVSVILTTGNHELPSDLLPLPDNFHHASYLPGIQLAKKCDLMIHHGGYGSCQTGLFTGTPAVIIPTFSERESNARRVAAVGAGEYVFPRTNGQGKKVIDLDEFREKIIRVLSTPSYSLNSQRQSQRMTTFGGLENIIQIIEKFIVEQLRVT